MIEKVGMQSKEMSIETKLRSRIQHLDARLRLSAVNGPRVDAEAYGSICHVDASIEIGSSNQENRNIGIQEGDLRKIVCPFLRVLHFTVSDKV